MTRLNPLLLKWEIRQCYKDRSLPPVPIARFRWRSDALNFRSHAQGAAEKGRYPSPYTFDIVEVWEAASYAPERTPSSSGAASSSTVRF